MKLQVIYVCHPYRDAPDFNIKRMRKYCQYITSQGHVPICPPLFFPQFACSEEDAAPMCIELVHRCDELWICSNRITPGMSAEINAAYASSLPVRHMHCDDLPWDYRLYAEDKPSE